MSLGTSDNGCGPHSIGRLLAHVHKYTRRYMSERLKTFGIGGPTYGFLFHLYNQDGLTESEITQHMLVDKATTTRSVSKLEELGYVNKRQDHGDRRVYRIFLTPKAHLLKPELDKVREEWIELVLGEFEEEERQTFLEMLTRIEM